MNGSCRYRSSLERRLICWWVFVSVMLHLVSLPRFCAAESCGHYVQTKFDRTFEANANDRLGIVGLDRIASETALNDFELTFVLDSVVVTQKSTQHRRRRCNGPECHQRSDHRSFEIAASFGNSRTGEFDALKTELPIKRSASSRWRTEYVSPIGCREMSCDLFRPPRNGLLQSV